MEIMQAKWKWNLSSRDFSTDSIGELKIDKNKVMFNIKDKVTIFPCTFINIDGNNRFKVFTDGQETYKSNRYEYKVLKAAMSNNSFEVNEDMYIDNIKSFSFKICELPNFLNKESVSYKKTKDNEFYIIENILPKIILKEKNPKIYIRYEIEQLFESITMTEGIIKNNPRIYIEYSNSVNDEQVFKDINCIMRFLGILNGYASYAEDIRLDIDSQELKVWMYYNYDFSYNLLHYRDKYSKRFEFEKIETNINDYFEKWYEFNSDDRFYLPREMFFSINKQKEKDAQEIFLNCCKVLEGYSLRINKDEEKTESLGKDLEVALKKTDIKTILDPIFNKVESTYKPKDVRKWIQHGFLGRIGLEGRLKKIDDECFNIITKNSECVIKSSEGNDYLSKIVKTRNYYSHFKADSSNILSFGQICKTINILKCIMLIILLKQMCIPDDDIKKIILKDQNYWMYANHLRSE